MNKPQAVAERKNVLPDNAGPKKEKNIFIRFIGECDRPFLILVILLTAIGSVMMFSASYAFAETNFRDSLYFARNQMIWILIGFVVLCAATLFVRPFFLRRTATILYAVIVALNVLVFFLGIATHGAVRQIQIWRIHFQPSELLKTMNVIMCARIVADRPSEMNTFRYGVIPFAILAVVSAGLCLSQSHLSATIINLLIIFFMMLLGGTNPILLGSIGGTGALVGFWASTNVDKLLNMTLIKEKLSHVYLRLLIWKDPFKYMKNAALNDPGWQPSQSLYAVSSGGLWGLGLGKSIEKHGYLPEPQNDYIFAIVCEELGFAGAAFIICLFALLIIRGFQIASKCRDRFSMLLVMGLVVKMALQVILNIAVVTNTIPSTGISLPFFSYGGTALIILLGEMGIILSVSRFSYLDKD